MIDGKLYLFTCDGDGICVNKNEAHRYMGLPRDYSNPEFEKIYGECLGEYCKNVYYKAAYKESSLSFGEGDELFFDFCTFSSKDLRKNLDGCKSVIVFAATTGINVDRLLLKYGSYSDLKLMTADCIASSGIECFCDKLNAVISEGRETKPRFSLGYGDTDLKYQRDLLSFLDAEKNLGITLNSSLMMTPKKSVTAFIGVK